MTGRAVTGPVLTVSPGDVSIRLAPGETILQGLYAAGYAYRTGCRNGGCGVCKADILLGEVGYPRPVAESVLSEEERESDACITCRAVPEGDISIALRDDCLRLTNPYRQALRAASSASIAESPPKP